MILKTSAILFNVAKFHSQKTNKDYNTLGLVIDGRAKSHFVRDEDVEMIMNSQALVEFRNNGFQPINVNVIFDVYCTEKGWGATLKQVD